MINGSFSGSSKSCFFSVVKQEGSASSELVKVFVDNVWSCQPELTVADYQCSGDRLSDGGSFPSEGRGGGEPAVSCLLGCLYD